MVDSTRAMYFTEPAKRASTMALDEVRRLHHAYRGPEHYLLGLLRQGDSLAAGCWSPTVWTWRPSAPRSTG
jgi:hypothetical protein